MKYYSFLSLLLCLAVSSCTVDEPSKDPDLISKWQLIEVLESPGAGETVFTPTDKKETVEFLVNSKVRRSDSWCPSEKVTLADYSSEDGKILVGCEENQFALSYVIKGNFLFIYPQCIEECAYKYRRIDNLIN